MIFIIKWFLNKFKKFTIPFKRSYDTLEVKNLPTYQDGRIQFYETDLYQHCLYSFLTYKNKLYNDYISMAIVVHINTIGRQEEENIRTVLANSMNVNYDYDVTDTSLDALLGLLLVLTFDDNPILIDKFYSLMTTIIKNYGLINVDNTISKNANMKPRLKMTEYEIHTFLAALKIGIKIGMRECKSHYDKLKKYNKLKSDNVIANYILGNTIYFPKQFKNHLEKLVFNELI